MMRPLVLLLTCLVLVPPAAAAARRPSPSYVLVVANNKSLDRGVRPLRFADDDGARYWELFSEVTSHVSLLTVLDPDTARIHPTAARVARVPWMRTLKEEVGRIAKAVRRDNRAGRRTSFTFVYVGHGNVGRDGEGYVNLQDVRLRRQDLFREIVDRIPAGTVHLVIDACKSFFLVSRGPGDWRDDRSGRTYREEVKAFLSRATLETHPNVGAILSTSGDEDVHEWSGFRSGVFSHQLRSALSGGADINGDGRVEYSEVGAFIAAANRRVVHQRARLRPFVQPPAANFHAPLFDTGHARHAVRLELGRALSGRFSLEDERGVRAADLNKASGTVLRLALDRSHRYFVRHAGQEAVLPRGSRGLIAYASLQRDTAAASFPRGSVDQAYRNDMFAVPLSRSFYDGYVATTDMPGVTFSAGHDQERAPVLPGPWSLDMGYLLSPAALDIYDGLQHTVSVGLRRDVWGPFYLVGRLELGISRHDLPANEGRLSLIRTALLAGGGATWRIPRARLALALEANVGYQLLATTVRDQLDPASAKLGTQLLVTFRPWRRLPRLGLVLRAGLYGHVVTVTNDQDQVAERVYALPEGGVGVAWGF